MASAIAMERGCLGKYRRESRSVAWFDASPISNHILVGVASLIGLVYPHACSDVL